MLLSSRGNFIKNGHAGTSEYKTIFVTENGVKILEGNGNNHSLPDYAHTPESIYAKMKSDGKTLHELRFYDKSGNPIIEIAYHPEPNINNGDRQTSVVHFHLYKGLIRMPAQLMSNNPEMKRKYAKYLKEFGLYDKC